MISVPTYWKGEEVEGVSGPGQKWSMFLWRAFITFFSLQSVPVITMRKEIEFSKQMIRFCALSILMRRCSSLVTQHSHTFDVHFEVLCEIILTFINHRVVLNLNLLLT